MDIMQIMAPVAGQNQVSVLAGPAQGQVAFGDILSQILLLNPDTGPEGMLSLLVPLEEDGQGQDILQGDKDQNQDQDQDTDRMLLMAQQIAGPAMAIHTAVPVEISGIQTDNIQQVLPNSRPIQQVVEIPKTQAKEQVEPQEIFNIPQVTSNKIQIGEPAARIETPDQQNFMQANLLNDSVYRVHSSMQAVTGTTEMDKTISPQQFNRILAPKADDKPDTLLHAPTQAQILSQAGTDHLSPFAAVSEMDDFIPFTESIVDQVTGGIADKLTGAQIPEDNFVIKLNPEGLGEITIELDKKDGKIQLNIAASDSRTDRIISEELHALSNTLREFNVEIRQSAPERSILQSFEAHTNQNFSSSAHTNQQFLNNGYQNQQYRSSRLYEYTSTEPERAPEAVQNYRGDTVLSRYI